NKTGCRNTISGQPLAHLLPSELHTSAAMRSLVAFVFICMVLPKATSGQLTCYACNPLKCDEYVKQSCPSGFNNCFTGS
ncbi:ly-6/neurotoxin-like protein 1 isoform X1, partial [Clarias magur]